MEKIIKYDIIYNDQKEPDYKTTYFYDFIDKTFIHISFYELFKELGDNCIKYSELEGGRPCAYFYIKESFNINLLKEKYTYLDININ